jgi:hypothetical protein
MENGNIRDFTRRNDTHCMRLLSEVASGAHKTLAVLVSVTYVDESQVWNSFMKEGSFTVLYAV